MFRESAGLLAFATLLATYACHPSGSKDYSLSANKRFLLDGNAVLSNISLEQFASCYLTCTPTYGKLLETCCKSGLSVVCSNLPWVILKPKLGSCPGLSKSPTTSAWLSLEQFAACFLTCVVGFEKLTEACCQTGLDAICTNLPWEILKSQLGSCRSELSTTKPSTLPQPYWSSWGTWTCGHQGSICFQTRERKCSTGVDKDCESRPGEMANIVRLCSESTCPDFFSTKTTRITATPTRASGLSTSSQMTSLRTPATIPIQTGTVTTRYTESTLLMTSSLPTPTLTTSQQPYWLPWGSWLCQEQSGACFQRRERNCSTGNNNDCEQSQGGKQYNVGLCTETSCPDLFSTTTSLLSKTPPSTPPSTTPKDPCQDDPTSFGCADRDILTEVCKENAKAWKLCRRSCGLCDSCWDYLNCSSQGAQKVFCGREEYAFQYCRKTCGKCAHKPVDIQLNKCGDPVTSELICDQLQSDICICNDPDLRALCGRYCENKCAVYGHPYTGSNCKPAMRKKREAILNQVVFN